MHKLIVRFHYHHLAVWPSGMISLRVREVLGTTPSAALCVNSNSALACSILQSPETNLPRQEESCREVRTEARIMPPDQTANECFFFPANDNLRTSLRMDCGTVVKLWGEAECIRGTLCTFGFELFDSLSSHCKATHPQQVARMPGFLFYLVLRGISRDDRRVI